MTLPADFRHVLVTGDWLLDEGERAEVYVAAENPQRRWNGFVVPFVTREVAERIVTAQAALVAQAGNEDTIALSWDGDTLVYSDPLNGDSDGPYVERVDPNEHGLYEVGFGWTWGEAMPPTVTDKESALAFVRWCIAVLGGGFHPDDSGLEYVNSATGQPTFTDEQADAYEDAREGLFTHLPDAEMYAAIEAAERDLAVAP